MKKFHFNTSPEVCSQSIDTETDDKNRIISVQFNGGCPGSLSAVAALVKNQTVEQAAKILSGIKCGSKNTSCPDQLARALKSLSAADKTDEKN